MNISFDLDDTLIPNTKKFLTEPQNFLQKILNFEEIRLGTPILINELQLKGHSIFIYTTSLRSESYIYWLFKSYNISIKNIINQKKHIKATKIISHRNIHHFLILIYILMILKELN